MPGGEKGIYVYIILNTILNAVLVDSCVIGLVAGNGNPDGASVSAGLTEC